MKVLIVIFIILLIAAIYYITKKLYKLFIKRLKTRNDKLGKNFSSIINDGNPGISEFWKDIGRNLCNKDWSRGPPKFYMGKLINDSNKNINRTGDEYTIDLYNPKGDQYNKFSGYLYILLRMIFDSDLDISTKKDYIASLWIIVYGNISSIYNKERDKFILVDEQGHDLSYDTEFFEREMTPIEFQNACFEFYQYVISTEEGCKKYDERYTMNQNNEICSKTGDKLNKEQISKFCSYLNY
jgi:hypothetical protein